MAPVLGSSVMILGSGRLADRLAKMFEESGVKIVRVESGEFKEKKETAVQESSMDYACDFLSKHSINEVSDICIVDKEDAVNIYLLMSVLAVREKVRIYAAFFNDNLVSDLVKRHRNVKVFNPASIVSKLFVESVPESMPEVSDIPNLSTYSDRPRDTIIFKAVFYFFVLIISSAWFFRITEGISWDKAFYFVTTVITSVNFNDAEVKNYNPLIFNIRTFLMFALYVVGPIFALGFIFNQVISHRADVFNLGRKKYKNKGHVIVCGLGKVGYSIVQRLVEKGEDIIVIESDQNNKYLPAVRSSGVSVLIGDATLPHYLIDAGVCRAKALVSAVDRDLTNLEIGRNARSENNNIRLLLRIFDQKTAEEMKKRLNIHYVISKSFATAKSMFDWIICYRKCVEINSKRV